MKAERRERLSVKVVRAERRARSRTPYFDNNPVKARVEDKGRRRSRRLKAWVHRVGVGNFSRDTTAFQIIRRKPNNFQLYVGLECGVGHRGISKRMGNSTDLPLRTDLSEVQNFLMLDPRVIPKCHILTGPLPSSSAQRSNLEDPISWSIRSAIYTVCQVCITIEWV